MGGNGSITESHREGEGGRGEGERGREGGRCSAVIRERRHYPRSQREDTSQTSEREKMLLRSPEREKSVPRISEREPCFPHLKGDPPEKMLPRSQRERKDTPPDLSERGSPSHQREDAPPELRETEKMHTQSSQTESQRARERRSPGGWLPTLELSPSTYAADVSLGEGQRAPGALLAR